MFKFLTAAIGMGSKIMDRLEDPARKHGRIVERRLKTREKLQTAISKGDLVAINRRIAQSRISLRKHKAAG